MTNKETITVLRIINRDYGGTYEIKRVLGIRTPKGHAYKQDMVYVEGKHRQVFTINGKRFCVVYSTTHRRTAR